MLKASWQFLFGDGRWRLRYVSVTLVFVMLAATAIYAWQESSAPSATPILFFMIFCSAFAILSVVFPANVWQWSGRMGYSAMRKSFMIVAALLFAGLLWKFLFQATDPNYPERLLRGRLLFVFEALLI